MKTKIYTYIDQDLIKLWEKLWETSPIANYTNGPQWFLSVLETFNYKEYALIALFEKEELVGIVALFKGKQFGVPVYAPLPSDYICGIPLLVNTSKNKHIKELLNAMQTLGTCYFDNIPEDFMNLVIKNSSTATTTEAAVNHFLFFSYDADRKLIFPNRKKLLRNIRHNPESFTLNTFDGTQKKGLEIVFHIDKQSRKQGRGYSTFANEKIRKFYILLTQHFGKYLKINILYFGKTPIAYELGFHIGTTYYGTQIAFIGEYRQYAPGKVLSVKLLEYLSSLNIKKFDFGSGDSHLKRMLTDQNQKLYQIVLSQQYTTRIYLKAVKETKASLYETMQKHMYLYKVYRNMVKIIIR